MLYEVITRPIDPRVSRGGFFACAFVTEQSMRERISGFDRRKVIGMFAGLAAAFSLASCGSSPDEGAGANVAAANLDRNNFV